MLRQMAVNNVQFDEPTGDVLDHDASQSDLVRYRHIQFVR